MNEFRLPINKVRIQKSVLVTAYACCPNLGSEAGNGWNWVMNYIRNGFYVTCVTSSIYKKAVQEYLEQHPQANLEMIFADSAISLSSFRIPVLGNYIHYYWWISKTRRFIKLRMANQAYDHAHHITYSSIKFGTPLYNLKCRIVLGPLGGSEMPHRSLNRYLGIYYYYESFKNSLSYLFAKINPTVAKSIQQAAVILTSNEISEQLVRRYSSKPTVRMFDAGLSDYFKKELVRNKLDVTIRVFWTGTMFPRKGLNLAIDAVARLPRDLNFHFTIVGHGQWLARSEKQVADLGLKDRVTFTGHVSHFEVMKIMQNSNILLFPSLIDSCPTQIFESFALGVPVVTLNHQGMKDQVAQGKTGLKVEIGDTQDYPGALANAMLAIVADPETFKRYSEAAYTFGQQQVWSSRISAFLQELYPATEMVVH